jgi:signal transduction histidine kinase
MEFNLGAYYKAADGKMYFGGMNGLNSFYPDSIKINEIPPKISFTGLKVLQQDLMANDKLSRRKILSKEIPYTENFILEHDENDVILSFAAFDFTDPNKNQYAYKLSPINTTWIHLGNKSEITFANLKPEAYQLHVKGSNNDGVWNEEGKIISFEILPPWWQTYWAYALYTIAVISVFIGFTLWRERYLKSQKNLLEDQIKKRTKSLLNAQAQLIQSEKMASLGQLTAGVAHEINNPVSFTRTSSFTLDRDLKEIMLLIKKYQDYIQEYGKQAKEIEEFEKSIDVEVLLDEINLAIQNIKEGTKRTSEIVKGLTEFSHQDHKQKEPANIHHGIDTTLSLLKSKLTTHIKVTKNYDQSIDKINCHIGQLNQIFMNILSNAIGAIEGEGEIKITTKDLGKSILLSIEDDGKGISEDNISKIFDPFFTTKKINEGTGLGLSISHGIIKNHGGTIKVNSSMGKGTRFDIEFPKN